jgi:uncharacterized protein YkwD
VPRWTLGVLTVLVVVLVVIPAQADAGTQPTVKKINAARRSHGLRALRYSASLGHSTRRYARHILGTGNFAHASHIWASRRFRRLGECLGLTPGFRLRRSLMVRMWLNSPAHRAILLSRSFNEVGVSAVRGKFHGHRATIWVAHFGHP